MRSLPNDQAVLHVSQTYFSLVSSCWRGLGLIGAYFVGRAMQSMLFEEAAMLVVPPGTGCPGELREGRSRDRLRSSHQG